MIKQWKKYWCLALSVSMLWSVPAYGDITVVPPAPIGNTTGSTAGPESSGNTGSTAGPGNTGNTAGPGNTGNIGSGITEVTTVKEPQIQAQGAVLMDAATGALLYTKNAETQYYPASITKLMTALLVAERCNLEDTVTFSKTAVTNLESGAVTLGLAAGDKLTVRQSMYGLLLKSANEVANGLAEHVSGSISAFSELMNAKARDLGCSGTNFVNPNGLNHSNHYTTPHDMALIARAAFQNQTVCKVSATLSYQIPATQKAEARTIVPGHKMLYPNDARYYAGVIGGKTGYTSLAGNTLVTCAERDGVRLIVVIMKSKSSHYADTKALLDYGFAYNGSNGSQARWEQSGSVWHFVKADGSKAGNEWMRIDGADYWFDSDNSMAIGWRQFSNGSWYYLGADGAMLKNVKTPDGFQVDDNGIWVN